MAFEQLLRSVEESAEEREREIRAKAQADAEAIRNQARLQADEHRNAAILEAERSAAAEHNRLLYLAKSDMSERGIGARDEIFRKAFAAAGDQLAGIRSWEKYPGIFQKLAREALDDMGSRPCVVHVDKRDLALCTETLESMGLTCGITADLQCAGGLVVSSPDGLIVLTNTIESRFERAKEQKRLDIYTVLSGG